MDSAIHLLNSWGLRSRQVLTIYLNWLSELTFGYYVVMQRNPLGTTDDAHFLSLSRAFMIQGSLANHAGKLQK